MIYPEMRHIHSPTLEPPALPPDPDDCAVEFHALIGPRGAAGAEEFAFRVVTPRYLLRMGPTWGRGYLIVERFEWEGVVRALAELLVQSARPTWEEIVMDLNRELRWQPSDRQTPGA